MDIIVNKKAENIPENSTVAQLLELKDKKKGASVWVNGSQLLKKDYQTHKLYPNDNVKILRIIGGG